jgi:hypothetical protein
MLESAVSSLPSTCLTARLDSLGEPSEDILGSAGDFAHVCRVEAAAWQCIDRLRAPAVLRRKQLVSYGKAHRRYKGRLHSTQANLPPACIGDAKPTLSLPAIPDFEGIVVHRRPRVHGSDGCDVTRCIGSLVGAGLYFCAFCRSPWTRGSRASCRLDSAKCLSQSMSLATLPMAIIPCRPRLRILCK